MVISVFVAVLVPFLAVLVLFDGGIMSFEIHVGTFFGRIEPCIQK